MSVESPLPTERTAWCIVKRGLPSEALRKQNLPMPTLEENEVLIRVQAAALNPVGYTMMKMLPMLLAGKRCIAEHDFAGVVADSRSPDFQPGESVFGWNPFESSTKNGEGALTTYVKTQAERLAKTPPGMSAVDVAGVSLVSLTAYQALFRHMNLQPGQTVFIHGGGTSVGRCAIQLAKAKGLTVVASASPRSVKEVTALGADEVFDYTVKPLFEQLIDKKPPPQYDGIFDAYGDPDYRLYSHASSYTQPSAIYLTTFPKSFGLVTRGSLPRWLGGSCRIFKWMLVKNDKDELKDVQQLLAQGTLKPQIDSVTPFDNVLEAYARLMSKKSKGKIIVQIP